MWIVLTSALLCPYVLHKDLCNWFLFEFFFFWFLFAGGCSKPFYINIEQANSGILAMLMGTIDFKPHSTVSDLDKGWVSQGQHKPKPLSFIFFAHVQLNR